MAQVPGFDEIRARKAEQQLMREAAQGMQRADQNTGMATEANKNPVLQRYMQQREGLGNIQQGPGAYTMQAAQMAQGRNQEQNSAAMVDAAINGQIDPMAVLNDPSVLDNDKAVLLSLMQGGPSDGVAPAGLGQLPPR